MHVTAHKLRALLPPRDSLFDALKKSKLTLKNRDVLCVSSKVVSIDEGRCLPIADFPNKEKLIEQEADWYMKAPKTSRYRQRFTITNGAMAGSAGIDESNGDGHYILYPKNPFASAKRIRAKLMKEHGLKELALIITDSTSVPLRRGAVGFALSWDGLDPLRDYRGKPDIFGRLIKIEMANLIDSLAAAAVFSMGEGGEQTPIAIIRGAENLVFKNRSLKKDQLIVTPDDDVFAPFLFRKELKWQKKKS